MPPWTQWVEADVDGAVWAGPGSPPAPPEGWPFGAWAKSFEPDRAWPRLGQGQDERRALRALLEEALKRASSCGASFLILPGAVGDPEAPTNTDELALLLDALAAASEREACPLWVPMAARGPAWVSGPHSALALSRRLALPMLRFALTASTVNGPLPWQKDPTPWNALAPELCAWLARGLPAHAWGWPGSSPIARFLVWWPEASNLSLPQLAEAAKGWSRAEVPTDAAPPDPLGEASFS